jgi:hypothetical protein
MQLESETSENQCDATCECLPRLEIKPPSRMYFIHRSCHFGSEEVKLQQQNSDNLEGVCLFHV